MLRHFMVIALRFVRRNFIFSIINLSGLALGMGASIILLLWIWNELSYDSIHTKRDRIMQVWSHTDFGDRMESRTGVAPLIAEKLRGLTFVEDVTLGLNAESLVLAADNAKICLGGRYVDGRFLQIFDFGLKQGSIENVLSDPFSIVLTESSAKKLFGDISVIGRTVRIENATDVVVTGILEDVPENSSFQFDYLLPLSLAVTTIPWVKDCMTDSDCDWLGIHALVKPGYSLDYVNERVKSETKLDREEYAVQNFLYPMTRWHLHGIFENGEESTNDRSIVVRNMAILAFGILVVASINFVNLSTARSESRAREVGIRKVAGSKRRQLILQFLGESFMMTSASYLIASLLVELMLPIYRLQTGSNLHVPYASPTFWLMSAVVVAVTATLAGLYPAFFLSSFKPVHVLKGQFNVSGRSFLPRQYLVGFQFGLSLVLIFSSIAIFQQINFGLNRQLGFEKENLIAIPDNEQLSRNYAVIKNELTSSGAILGMVKTNSPITDIYEVNYLKWARQEGEPLTCTNIFTDYDYCKTMRIKLTLGRDFSPDVVSDSSAILLNETAVAQMGIIDPIGEEISVGSMRYKIIGVMQDVVMTSPYAPIDPLYMVLMKDWETLSNRANVSIRLADLTKLEEVKTVLAKYAPDYPFDFDFATQKHAAKFGEISFIATVTTWFTGLSVFIALLGLFGLAAFMAERKEKEFGIRKVLGASTGQLIKLMTSSFVKLAVVSFLMATPFGWWIVSSYLESYPYHTEISWWLLPACGLSLLVLTMAITGAQAWRAAQTNPAERLRAE